MRIVKNSLPASAQCAVACVGRGIAQLWGGGSEGGGRGRGLAALAVVVHPGMLLLSVGAPLAAAARVHLPHLVAAIQLVSVHLERLLFLVLKTEI